MGRSCEVCQKNRPALRRPKTGQQVCRECFFCAFEDEIHRTIVENRLFKKGDRVAIAASGGKDSTVLAHIMTLLNKRHDYGLDLFLLSIDEGITGYRDDSLETVKRNEVQYGIPLKVVSYKTLYGWTMDDIVREIGRKNNCTFCGVFRRQALDRGGVVMKADKMATGHNADDIAETVLLNILRGDIARLARCTAITTGEDSVLPRYILTKCISWFCSGVHKGSRIYQTSSNSRYNQVRRRLQNSIHSENARTRNLQALRIYIESGVLQGVCSAGGPESRITSTGDQQDQGLEQGRSKSRIQQGEGETEKYFSGLLVCDAETGNPRTAVGWPWTGRWPTASPLAPWPPGLEQLHV
ncbi:hypothetical protein AXG93_1593s1760 [Marchantia polymorpha subsp. ruderalis]|uniref:tRNA(Ile)-lysidine/2-thiocytidine synthase N-terminal domain-containing protein n=1 Tax=Marchantia polymorpha subsp. ruderalis TaxID=1480154 RepID=A0A176WM49_MARPO|nr:hypothetical protein AXG93_1593s1760 [Marchantia polymorpha subsp. ruderalis]